MIFILLFATFVASSPTPSTIAAASVSPSQKEQDTPYREPTKAFYGGQALANDKEIWFFLSLWWRVSPPQSRYSRGTLVAIESHVVVFDGEKISRRIQLRSLQTDFNFHPKTSSIMRFGDTFFVVESVSGGAFADKPTPGRAFRWDGKNFHLVGSEDGKLLERDTGIGFYKPFDFNEAQTIHINKKTGWQSLLGFTWGEGSFRWKGKEYRLSMEEEPKVMVLQLLNSRTKKPVAKILTFERGRKPLSAKDYEELLKKIADSQKPEKGQP